MDAKFAREMAAAEVAVTSPTKRDRAKRDAWLSLAGRLKPTATEAPAVTVAEPPATAKLHRDLTTAAGWDSENGGTLQQLAERGPGDDPVLRSTLSDGQTGAAAGNGMAHERNDMRAGDIGLGEVRFIAWHERFTKLVDTEIDSWQLIGPEIHGHTLDQAPVMLQVGADKRRRLNTNAGRDLPRNFDLGPIVVGQWRHYMLGLKVADDDTGWLELWQDGKKVVNLPSEPTTIEHVGGYWKLGHYRNADIAGTSVYDISGARIYSA